MLICEMNLYKKELDHYLDQRLRKSRFPLYLKDGQTDGQSDISSYIVALLLKTIVQTYMGLKHPCSQNQLFDPTMLVTARPQGVFTRFLSPSDDTLVVRGLGGVPLPPSLEFFRLSFSYNCYHLHWLKPYCISQTISLTLTKYNIKNTLGARTQNE